MTTVFRVPGYSQLGNGYAGDLTDWFSGALSVGKTPPALLGTTFGPITASNYVHYKNFNILSGQVDGALQIDTVLHALPVGEKAIVLGHSMGAYSIWTWLENYAPTSTLDVSSVLFIMTGAKMQMKTAAHVTGSRFRVVDITAEWDKYADYPNVASSMYYNDAVTNCNDANIHATGYPPISLDSVPDQQNVIGSATYLFWNTPVIPMAGVTREQLDSAYNRQYLIPLALPA